MSYKEGEKIHIEDDDAMAGAKTGTVRWVLLISLLAAILILSVIWIAGAWLQNNEEASYVPPPPAPPIEQTVNEDGVADVDGVLIEESVPEGDEEVVGGDM